MSSPVVPNSGPNNAIPIGFPSANNLNIQTKDSLSLFDFLQSVGTATSDSKKAIFDGQEVDALVNQEYFLGVAKDIQFLSQKYIQVSNFADGYSALISSYNARVDDTNTLIDTFNAKNDELNSKIADMNNAINTINSISSPTAADIQTYNNAVLTYNNYLTTTGNPFLLNYASNINSTYNIPTNNDNTVTIPQLNDLNNQIKLGIPDIPPLSPASISTGPGALPLQENYVSTPIALISPSDYPDQNHLNTMPGPRSKTDTIDTYFMPFATAYLAAIAATSKKLSGIDDYRAFVNFIQKQGFKLDPSKVDSFILNASKPSLPTASSGQDGGSIGTLIVSTTNPNLQLILSTALFKAISGNAALSIPPNIYDQINVFALSLLRNLGASAGYSLIKLLGDKLKSIPLDNPSISVALAAAILQNILKVVNDGKATLEALKNILKGIPGISADQVDQLANKLLAAQNTSLLMFGALNAGVQLKAPDLVQNVVNTSLSDTPFANTTPSFPSSPVASSTFSPTNDEENPYSSTGVNSTLNNPNSSYQVQQTLSDRLASDAKIPKPQANSIVQKALENTKTALPSNATTDQLKKILADELLKQNLAEEQAQFLAENAAVLLQPKPTLTPAELAKQLQNSIQEVLKGDITSPLPETVSQVLIKSLTDTKDPNSFASLLVTQLQSLEVHNDKKLADQVILQRREFEKPNIDVFMTYKRMMDPANSVLLSYMTGVMYDRSIPSNWQRPLSIQI